MNIKRRISVSNVLMLLVPAGLIAIIAVVLFLVFSGLIKIGNDSFYDDSELFWRQIEKVDGIIASWSANRDMRSIEADIDQYNSRYKGNSLSLSLYDGERLVYPEAPMNGISGERLFQLMADGAQSHTGIFDNYAFHSKKIDGYTAVLMCSRHIDMNVNYTKYRNMVIDFVALLVFLLISIICATNYLLTRNIYKSIVVPLDILNYGVHQIQLGNYDFYIEYGKQDEFSVVCADFNLMAKRLRESVELQKKDENNRNELIAGISHDLRTPLTSIKAYVDGIIDGIAASPEAQRGYLETIKLKAENIDQIVDRLFLFSKLNMGEFPFYLERLDIGEELADFVEATAEEYRGKGLEEKLLQNTGNVMVAIDPVQFRNALTNILENSVKYKTKECGLVEIICVEEQGEVRITLTDDGPGVPAGSLDKIFDVFYRNDPSRNNPSAGSGLGLAITAKIIERLGGQIGAENVPGGGLRISIVLRCAKQTGETA